MSKELIKEKMYDKDAFSKWLGMEIIEVENGNCTLTMKVRAEMMNGFQIAHGGITYALADSALAFASNSYGDQAVSIETSISHTRPVKSGDTLIAQTKQVNKSKKFARYTVEIINQEDKLVAVFNGTVFFTGEKL